MCVSHPNELSSFNVSNYKQLPLYLQRSAIITTGIEFVKNVTFNLKNLKTL